MRQKLIFTLVTAIFFFLYMEVMGWVWDRLFAIDPAANILALLIILVLILPLSAISAQKSLDIFKAL